MQTETFVRIRVPRLLYTVRYRKRDGDEWCDEVEYFSDHTQMVRRTMFLMKDYIQYRDVSYLVETQDTGWDRTTDPIAAVASLSTLYDYLKSQYSSIDNNDRVDEINESLNLLERIAQAEFNITLDA